jgi:hypothetical protein
MSVRFQRLRSCSSSRTISPWASKRARARDLLQQHQRQQPEDFRDRWEQAQQQPAQADRFVRQGCAGRRGVGRAAVTLVEE